jgi:DNA-binding response OmpR family regulator
MTLPPIACPCCGAPVKSPIRLEDVPAFAELTQIEARLFIILAAKAGQRLRCYQIADQLYSLDADGGPEDVNRVIKVHAFNIRAKIERLGWTIKGQIRRGGYTLAVADAS